MNGRLTACKWAVTPKIGTNSFIVYSDLGDNEIYNICYLDDEYNSIEETKANAKLIAAAPELLKELEAAHNFLNVFATKLPDGDWLSAIKAGLKSMKEVIDKAK